MEHKPTYWQSMLVTCEFCCRSVQHKCKTYIYDSSSRDNWHHLEDLSRWYAIIYRVDKCSPDVQTSLLDCSPTTSPFSQNRRPDTTVLCWYSSILSDVPFFCFLWCQGLVNIHAQSHFGTRTMSDPKILPNIFNHLASSLCRLSIIFGEKSATGVNFMRILCWWLSSLQNMKVLKLSYNYNEVLRYFVQILALYDLLSRQVIWHHHGLALLGPLVLSIILAWKF